MKSKTLKFKSVVERKDFLVTAFNLHSIKFEYVSFISKVSYNLNCRNKIIYESEDFGSNKSSCLDYLLSFVISNRFDFLKSDNSINIRFSHDSHVYLISLHFSNELPF